MATFLPTLMVTLVFFILIEEMIIAVVWMIVGGFFYTFTIGNLTTVISNQNTRQSQINDRVNAIN